ncbi:MAG: peptidyl-prolyl cis-trans isomerase [Nitrospirota bacterium]
MKAFKVLAVICILSSGCSQAKEKGPLSPALATVNGAPVSVRQFKDRLLFLNLSFGNLSGRTSAGKDAKMDLLSQLIYEEMCVQEAKRLGIAVSAREVDERLAQAGGPAGRGIEGEDFDPGRYREILSREMTVEKLIQSVYSKTRVTREQAEAYFNLHAQEFKRPARVHARQIVVASLGEAKAVQKELQAGADFAAVARVRSLSPDSGSGGDLGYFSRGDMPPEFESVVFSLKPGRISEIIKTPYGYHIFKVEDFQQAQSPDFREAEPEVVKRLTQETGEAEFERWRDGLRARTKVTVNLDLLGTL